MTTVLCIDDNEANRYLLLAVLDRTGFKALAAVDGESGVDLARAERPDLVLMDIEMPGMTGIEATRRLKDMPETKDIPVIALSAHDDRKKIDEALKAGCAGYAFKPLNLMELLGTIRDVLAGSGATQPAVEGERSRA